MICKGDKKMHLLHLFPIPHNVARHLEGNENNFPPFPALSDDQSLIRDIFICSHLLVRPQHNKCKCRWYASCYGHNMLATKRQNKKCKALFLSFFGCPSVPYVPRFSLGVEIFYHRSGGNIFCGLLGGWTIVACLRHSAVLLASKNLYSSKSSSLFWISGKLWGWEDQFFTNSTFTTGKPLFCGWSKTSIARRTNEMETTHPVCDSY